MTEITIKDVQIGMKLKLNKMAGFEYVEWGRVEVIGCDWVAVRASNGTIHLLTEDLDYLEVYEENEDAREEDQLYVPLQNIGPIRCESDKD